MRLWLAFLTLSPLLAACGFDANGGGSDGGGSNKIDAPPPCFGAFSNVCLSATPKAPLNVTGTMEINTDTASTQCDAKSPQSAQYCIVAATSFSIPSGAVLSAHGARPLVLVASDPTATFQLDGEIDVNSSIKGATPTKGAGANSNECATLAAFPATTTGGAYGGSFGSKGGDGSDGEGIGAVNSKGLAAAPLSSFPTALRGGCAGGDGAATGSAGESTGGNGGGAVYIIAHALEISGRINASGAAGRGGASSPSVAGGGGGGTGGMIVVEATITTQGKAQMWANGGGGGQGGATGATGLDGNESTGANTPALTTQGTTDGGDGGGGNTKDQAALSGVANASKGAGGGGGGGGGGYIRATGFTGSTSPPSTP
jgi:hypothetical protein